MPYLYIVEAKLDGGGLVNRRGGLGGEGERADAAGRRRTEQFTAGGRARLRRLLGDLAVRKFGRLLDILRPNKREKNLLNLSKKTTRKYFAVLLITEARLI